MFSDMGAQALHVTRATSQVCRHWRNLMLNTPSLWAKSIDLNLIFSGSFKIKWLEELLRRSRTAPLWIKGNRIPLDRPAELSEEILRSVFKITTENWHRIEKLIV